MKKITTIILSLMILLFASASYACEFRVGQFGDPKEKIKIEPIPFAFPDRFDGVNVVFPIKRICKNSNVLEGTMVNYLYINNQLSQIALERANMNDKKLLNFAMKKYGLFDLPKSISKKDWRGSHNWESGHEVITYFVTDILQGEIEVLTITNKLYHNKIVEHDTKMGKWLDTQK